MGRSAERSGTQSQGPVPWPQGAQCIAIPGTSGFVLKRLRDRLFIAQGSQGTVYFAESTLPQHQARCFAIKFPDLAVMRLPEIWQEVYDHEITLGQQISSPYIARTEAVLEIQEAGWERARFCYVMKHYDWSLEAYVVERRKQHKRIPGSVLSAWAAHLAQAFRDLHEERLYTIRHQREDVSLVHRDFHPRNIMIDLGLLEGINDDDQALDTSRAVIVDLGTIGIAHRHSKLTVRRSDRDDAYKSPEFYAERDAPSDPASDGQWCDPTMDIHAFGALMNDFDKLDQGHWPSWAH